MHIHWAGVAVPILALSWSARQGQSGRVPGDRSPANGSKGSGSERQGEMDQIEWPIELNKLAIDFLEFTLRDSQV